MTSSSPTPTASRRNISGSILNTLGFIFFGFGALYTVASHDLHDLLPFFAGLPHDTHLWIGVGMIVLGAALLITAGMLAKRRTHQVVAHA